MQHTSLQKNVKKHTSKMLWYHNTVFVRICYVWIDIVCIVISNDFGPFTKAAHLWQCTSMAPPQEFVHGAAAGW